MDLKTIIISILGSGVIAAIVTGLMNRANQIKAIKESGIYAKRAEILDELMKRMELLDTEMRNIQFSLMDDLNIELTTDSNVSKAQSEFSKFFTENKHYLPKRLSIKINYLLYEYQKIDVQFQRDKHINKVTLNSDELDKRIREIIFKVLKKKEDITDEFRKIIGVK